MLGGSTGKGFVPGVSGNPAGRPLSPVAQIIAKSNNGERMVALLLSIVDGKGKPKPRWSDRIEAARLLLDRGWGRPLQTTEVTGPGGGPIQSLNIMATVDTDTLRKLVELRDQVLMLQASSTVEGSTDETTTSSDDNQPWETPTQVEPDTELT